MALIGEINYRRTVTTYHKIIGASFSYLSECIITVGHYLDNQDREENEPVFTTFHRLPFEVWYQLFGRYPAYEAMYRCLKILPEYDKMEDEIKQSYVGDIPELNLTGEVKQAPEYEVVIDEPTQDL